MILDQWEILKPSYLKVFVDSRAALSPLEARVAELVTVLRTINALNVLGEKGTRINPFWV